MYDVSIIISTLNENESISQVLDSIQGIAGEIIVIDGYSTDDTSESLKEYDVKVILMIIERALHYI